MESNFHLIFYESSYEQYILELFNIDNNINSKNQEESVVSTFKMKILVRTTKSKIGLLSYRFLFWELPLCFFCDHIL